MNKKGFTVVELIMSFVLVSIFLVGLMRITMNYRERVYNEEIKSSLVDFQNTMTKLVYDDIIKDKYQKIETCSNDRKCANFVDYNGVKTTIKLVNQDNNLYLEYLNHLYLVPDSINVSFDDFDIRNNEDLSHLRIVLHDSLLNEDFVILVNIN